MNPSRTNTVARRSSSVGPGTVAARSSSSAQRGIDVAGRVAVGPDDGTCLVEPDGVPADTSAKRSVSSTARTVALAPAGRSGAVGAAVRSRPPAAPPYEENRCTPVPSPPPAPTTPPSSWRATGARSPTRELDDEANRLSQLFRSAGLQPGDHVAFCLENHPRFLRRGLGLPLRRPLLHRDVVRGSTTTRWQYILNDCGAKAFITSAYKARRGRRARSTSARTSRPG